MICSLRDSPPSDGGQGRDLGIGTGIAVGTGFRVQVEIIHLEFESRLRSILGRITIVIPASMDAAGRRPRR